MHSRSDKNDSTRLDRRAIHENGSREFAGGRGFPGILVRCEAAVGTSVSGDQAFTSGADRSQ